MMSTSKLTTVALLSVTIVGMAVMRPDAQARAERVQAFKRLTTPRIDPGPVQPIKETPKGLPFDESPTFTKRYMETSGTRGAGIMCPSNLTPMCKGLDNSLSATIPMRDREIVILRTAWLARGAFIWATHADTRSKDAGVTAEDLTRLMRGPDAPGWSAWDATLVRAVDELHASRFITDATWKALGDRYSVAQRLELILTMGNYNTRAMLFNSVGSEGLLGPKWPGFPGE